MIKKILVAQLRVGMFVHDFNCHWMDHPFPRNHLLITSDAQLEKVIRTGIPELYIDTSKGLDVADAPTLQEARADLEKEIVRLATKPLDAPPRRSVAEEMARAREVKDQAYQLVRTVMHDVRLGKAVELDQVEPVVENITESILRNPGALIGLLRIKNKDDYTFLHSVSVCTMLVAFCRSTGMDAATTHQAGLGGLLHDTGKALVPDSILNKPGRLTEEEFEVIKRHPQDGYNILRESKQVGDIPLDITLHHHERMDGRGYPDKLPGDRISLLAQMAAIVDVYDAITADRCYRKGMPAAEALRKIYEWSKFHFRPEQVQQFIRCVGIYPVGTLVMLESQRLGVVVEPHETNLLAPTVNVFFNAKSKLYIKPQMVDLSNPLGAGGGDKIVSHELPEKWQVDPMKFFSLEE